MPLADYMQFWMLFGVFFGVLGILLMLIACLLLYTNTRYLALLKEILAALHAIRSRIGILGGIDVK